MSNELTRESLQSLFDYREDGNLIRKTTTSHNAKIGDVAGGMRPDGYYRLHVNNKRYLLHRIIFLYHHGYLPKYLDHIDRNPSNNRIENLRPATSSQNHMNARKRDSDNSSRFKGVSFHTQNHNWKSRIYINGKEQHIGVYESEKLAALAYNEVAIELFGEYARLNVID